MYRSILVPLDGSMSSEAGLPIAVNIARRTGATLHLVYVQVPATTLYVEGLRLAEGSAASAQLVAAGAYLEGVRARLLSQSGITITCDIADRPIVGAIADQAIATGADLLILATHGSEGLARLWRGSVTDALVRWSRVPILLQPVHTKVRNIGHPQQFRQIMILLDGSALAEQILEPAVELGTVMRAEFTLLHVVEPFRLEGSTQLIDSFRPTIGAAALQQLQAQAYLDRVATAFKAQALPVCTRVLNAPDPARAILHHARLHRMEVIAMTSHGRGGHAHPLLGRVAVRMLHNSEFPVLIYQPQMRRGSATRDEGFALQVSDGQRSYGQR